MNKTFRQTLIDYILSASHCGTLNQQQPDRSSNRRHQWVEPTHRLSGYTAIDIFSRQPICGQHHGAHAFFWYYQYFPRI